VAATRTQIYLSDEQRRKIDKIVEAEGVSLAEVVRRALDSYLSTAIPDPRAALEQTFGALPDLEVPNRDEWDRG
jgi:Ribbon-helix-helix protein, copG family